MSRLSVIVTDNVIYDDESKKYLAIDNRMGDALVEELDTMQECMSWLMYGT